MANNPNNHVIPSTGVIIIAALINDLLEYTKQINSVAQIQLDWLSEKSYIGCIFVYWYRIGTMTEKAADTDMCTYLERHAHVHTK